MRILVTNDDGIDAPGIKLLEKAARKLSRDVWVVAPESEQSAVAHGLTIRRPLRIREIGERRFASWSMGQVNMSRLNPSLLLKYSATAALDPFAVSGKVSLALFEELVATASVINHV
jgi:hypothetical protein